jgi:hypothetical protein
LFIHNWQVYASRGACQHSCHLQNASEQSWRHLRRRFGVRHCCGALDSSQVLSFRGELL